MKSKHVLIKLILIITIFIPALSYAETTISIGGTAWYIWWKPAWTDAKTLSTIAAGGDDTALFLEDSHDFRPSSNLMGGPIISIGFLERWSIQSVFTIGRFTSKSGGISLLTGLVPPQVFAAYSNKRYNRDILKWDSDTSFGCSVHRIVKIFAGFKAQGYRYEERMQDSLLNDDIYYKRLLTDDVQAYGGGLGLGLTIPVVTEFYIMMSASGIALWSQENITIKRNLSYIIASLHDVMPLLIMPPKKGRYFSCGGTASLSFVYNIEKINTTISLGGRYQILFNRQKYNKNNPFNSDVSMNIIDKEYDHFAGVTLSAIYTFHLGRKA